MLSSIWLGFVPWLGFGADSCHTNYEDSNSNIYNYRIQGYKIHSTNKINPFNHEDLNIFLQYYFLQLYFSGL
jgi:hypothetical protein